MATERMRADSTLEPGHDKPQIYQVQHKITFENNRSRLRQVMIGKEATGKGKETKVIMMLGETGSGKTTTLNMLFNFILGVCWEDSFRFRLIHEQVKENQARSQTSWVTAYVIHWQPGFKVDYNLIIVDTPGYGDTRGIDQDMEITKQLCKFFGDHNNPLIDHLDAVLFVVNSTQPRLTDLQGYIFDSVLALFGKDMEENIAVLATFADANVPPAKASLDAAGVPYSKLMKFNNSALFASNVTEDDDDDDSGSGGFDELYWKMGMRSFTVLSKYLQKVAPKKLDQTRQVFSERGQIELKVDRISKDVRKGIDVCERIRREIEMVKTQETEVERNKNHTCKVPKTRIKLDPLPQGVFVTNCSTCDNTCHYDCSFIDHKDKRRCWAMNSEGYCHQCTGKCHWSVHSHTPHNIVLVTEMVTETYDGVKRRYEAALGKALTHKELLEEQIKEFKTVQREVLENSNEVRQGLNRLKDIALKTAPLTHVDYIEKLIRVEENTCKPGYSDRVKQLQMLLQQAKQLQEMSTDDYDPFKEHREALKERAEHGATASSSGLTIIERMASKTANATWKFLGLR